VQAYGLNSQSAVRAIRTTLTDQCYTDEGFETLYEELSELSDFV